MTDPSILASDPEISAFVSANAGSGKTHTLANRVTRLLLAGAKPQHILCLTFTKAAAAEMQHRLFRQLGEWAMLPDAALTEKIAGIGAPNDASMGDLPRARRLFAMALETPGGLKVLTIHAFCQIVLTRFPLEAGVAPGFEVLDDSSARALIGEARQQILERAGSGDARLAAAVSFLMDRISEHTLGQVLDAALGNDRRKMDRFFAGIGGDAAALEAAIWQAHGAPAGKRAHDIATSFCAELKSEIAIVKKTQAWLGSSELAALITGEFAAPGFEALRALLHTQAGAARKKLATKDQIAAQPDLAAWLAQLQARFCAADDVQRAAANAELTHAALTIIAAVRETYANAKARMGVLDYDDLIIRTLDLLDRRQAAQWVLFKLDGGMDHILIDEAQDTSPAQWAIVKKLTEEFFAGEGRERKNPRTIFAVGDEKQSIFSFQGADPAQFDINRSHFKALVENAGLGFAEPPLVTSRRSAPDILHFVDQVFAEPAARAGLTSRGLVIQHSAHRKDARGGITVSATLVPEKTAEIDPYLPVDANQLASPVVRLADKVAEQIRGWIADRLALPGHDAPIKPGDIMILLGRREPFGGEVIRALKRRGIAVAGADRIILMEQMAVMDLVALGRFALQRDDDLNLAALLRSPLCGISEEELYTLAHRRAGSLWQALAAQSGKFAPAHAFLSAMLARADYAPPFEFYTHALTELEGRQKLLARLGPESADAIAEFLSLSLSYERGFTPSLEGFLDWIEQGGAEIKRDMERGRNEVRVMTVHGAKGLEADIVILPDTTTLPQPPSRKFHMLYTGDGVLYPASTERMPEVVAAAKLAENEQTMAEHRRLLYVALTRARDRLVIAGFENTRGVGDGSWYSMVSAAADKIGRPITRGEEDLRGVGDVDDAPAPPGTDQAQTATALPAWIRRPAPRETVTPRLIRPSDAVEDLQFSSPARGNANYVRRGEIIHALLARLPEIAREQRRDIALKLALSEGFDEKLVDETLGVLEHPDFAAAFSIESRAEVAFQAELARFGPGALVLGRVDRLSVTDDEVLILDFKTGRPPATVDAASPQYLAQMALYREGAARIFPGRRIACGLVWTEGPLLMRLPDALMDVQLARIAQKYGPDGAS